MGLHIVILAAGRGKRMASETPKILHRLGGMPLLAHVVNTAQMLEPNMIHVVYGNGGETVKEQMPDLDVNWVHQAEQLGTGHAVAQALPQCKDDDQILVLYADVPLISIRTLKELAQETPHNGVGLVVTELTDPTGFGRIIRNDVGNILAIVEERDATPAQREVTEVNTGILTTSAKHLKNWLPRVNNKNNQHEYYLTDIIALAVDDGSPVGGVMAHCAEEVQGVNDRWQLTQLERYYQKSLAHKLTLSGVTVMDATRLDIRGDVQIDTDVTLDINVVLEGVVKIGKHSVIGPNVYLKDVEIADHVSVLANSVIEGAKIAAHAQIGPFARIRPNTVVDAYARVGNFVELKNSQIGEESKVSHLSYIGDATIGKQVNIGAGTITCNYDGVNKWPTVIGDGAFIGSNSCLIAPLTIGAKATIAAGSAVSKEAPAEQLTIAREKQQTLKGWKRPTKKS